MKNLGRYGEDLSIPRKKDVDAKQDKITVNGIVQGDGAGNLSTAETINTDLLDLNPAAVGLGNVDNTSDANKPISAATQTALNEKLDKTAVVDVTADAIKGQAADAKSVYDKLQALPTGTDLSLGITSATVGNIVKVKAVDANGKPTEWEAVDGVDIWEIIADYTATEVASWITINKDTKGNSFSLKKVDVEILLPNAVSGGTWYLYFSPSAEFYGVFSIKSQGSATCIIHCTAASDDITTLGLKRDKDYSSEAISFSRTDSYKAITAVRLGNWSDLTFPAGARILVKGVRI